jgi:hypothetical protein
LFLAPELSFLNFLCRNDYDFQHFPTSFHVKETTVSEMKRAVKIFLHCLIPFETRRVEGILFRENAKADHIRFMDFNFIVLGSRSYFRFIYSVTLSPSLTFLITSFFLLDVTVCYVVLYTASRWQYMLEMKCSALGGLLSNYIHVLTSFCESNFQLSNAQFQCPFFNTVR